MCNLDKHSQLNVQVFTCVYLYSDGEDDDDMNKWYNINNDNNG